jgi:hypothetical protein
VSDLNLSSVTLVAIDGAGTNPKTIKALEVSRREINYGDTLLLTPNTELYSAVPSNIRHEIIPSMSYKGWNEFVLKSLGDFITTEHYLYVDYDGFVIYPQAWSDKFLEYDYVGAPFWYPTHVFTSAVDQQVKDKPKDKINLVGNGGFTLRSKSFAKVAKTCPDIRYTPEDVYSCFNNYDYFVSKGIRFAPFDLASRFSYNQLHTKTNVFGFHGHKTHINNI